MLKARYTKHIEWEVCLFHKDTLGGGAVHQNTTNHVAAQQYGWGKVYRYKHEADIPFTFNFNARSQRLQKHWGRAEHAGFLCIYLERQ